MLLGIKKFYEDIHRDMCKKLLNFARHSMKFHHSGHASGWINRKESPKDNNHKWVVINFGLYRHITISNIFSVSPTTVSKNEYQTTSK